MGNESQFRGELERHTRAINDLLRRLKKAEEDAKKALTYSQNGGGGFGGSTGGEYAFLSASGTITSGTTLGTLGTVTSGTVVLETRSSASTTAGSTDITAKLFNRGGAISGGASGHELLVMAMTDGSYTVVVDTC